MATNNYSIIDGSVRPSDSGTYITGEAWGIDSTLSGFIIQSEDFTDEVVTDQTQDQKGRVVSELDYDRHQTCTIGVIGKGTPPAVGSVKSYKPDALSAAVNWKVRDVQYAGAYNDKKKYTISLERWQNFPAAAN